MTGKPAVFRTTERILTGQTFSVFSLPPDVLRRRLFAPVIKRAKGAYLYDHDGNRFVDLDMLDGSVLHGHANPRMTAAMKGWAGRGYAAGLPSAGHDVPARAVMETLFSEEAVHEGERYGVVFTDSAASAVLAVSGLLRMRGVRRVYTAGESLLGRCMGGVDENPVEAFLQEGAKAPAALITPPPRETDRDGQRRTLEKLDGEGGLLVIDELSIHDHLLGERRQELVRRADVRVLGPWIAGGVSFGCLLIRRDICGRLRDARAAIETGDAFRRLVLPPTYMLKTALRALGLLREAGGVAALRRRYARLQELLGTEHLRREECLTYVEVQGKGSVENVRNKLLEKGVYIPHTTDRPLSVSLAHDDELLKRAAELIHSLVNGSFR